MSKSLFVKPSALPRTKQQAVYEALRAEILDGRLAPGCVVVIDALAKRFQVSIIPVREALRQLQAERLVEIRPHTGVRVTPVDLAGLREIFTLLGALEAETAVAALPLLEACHLEAMDGLLERLEAAAAGQDSAAFEQANREFHLLPCRIAGFSRSAQILRELLAEWERLHRQAFQGALPPDPVQANRDHRAMVEAFQGGDAAALERVIRRHNATALTHYQRLAAV